MHGVGRCKNNEVMKGWATSHASAKIWYEREVYCVEVKYGEMRRNDGQWIYSEMWFFMDWQLQIMICMSVVLKPKLLVLNTQ